MATHIFPSSPSTYEVTDVAGEYHQNVQFDFSGYTGYTFVSATLTVVGRISGNPNDGFGYYAYPYYDTWGDYSETSHTVSASWATSWANAGGVNQYIRLNEDYQTVYITDFFLTVTYITSVQLTVADTIHVHDALGTLVGSFAADVVHAHDAQGTLVSSYMADVIHAHDALATFFGYIVSVADTIHVHDALGTWVSHAVSDIVHAHDSLGRWVSTVFSDTIRLADSWVGKVYSTLADVVHAHDSAEGHPFMTLVVSDIIHLRDCVVRWRWLDAVRNLGRGRCPQPPVRTQDSINDGYEG